MTTKKCEAEIRLEGKNQVQLMEFLRQIPMNAISSIRTEPYYDQRDAGGTYLVYKWTEEL